MQIENSSILSLLMPLAPGALVGIFDALEVRIFFGYATQN